MNDMVRKKSTTRKTSTKRKTAVAQPKPKPAKVEVTTPAVEPSGKRPGRSRARK